jgi:hypothetical protein
MNLKNAQMLIDFAPYRLGDNCPTKDNYNGFTPLYVGSKSLPKKIMSCVFTLT